MQFFIEDSYPDFEDIQPLIDEIPQAELDRLYEDLFAEQEQEKGNH